MMRSRDPRHTARQAQLQSQPPVEWRRQVAITAYKDPDYVSSEVVAALVRARYGQSTGQLDAAVNALHRRMVGLTKMRIERVAYYKRLAHNQSELVEDAVSYIWDKLLSDADPVPNCEVRFAVFHKDRLDDFMRQQGTFGNSMASSDDMDMESDEGEPIRLIDTVVDPEGESSEEYTLRMEQHQRVYSALMNLPRPEQKAFYLREECEFDWAKVANIMGCSAPTARKYYKTGKEKLTGEL